MNAGSNPVPAIHFPTEVKPPMAEWFSVLPKTSKGNELSLDEYRGRKIFNRQLQQKIIKTYSILKKVFNSYLSSFALVAQLASASVL